MFDLAISIVIILVVLMIFLVSSFVCLLLTLHVNQYFMFVLILCSVDAKATMILKPLVTIIYVYIFLFNKS